jgi:outer membrane protein TolC
MIQQLKLDALRAQKANLPQLNVNGGAAWTDVEHSYGSANNNLWPGPGYNWNAGASLSIPLGMRATHAALRQARDNMNSEQVSYDQADQQLIVQVRTDVRAVTADVENVAATGQAEVLSQKQYDLQKAKFDAGLATSYDTLQAQITLEQARVAQIQAEVSLRLALANLHFLEGTSLGQYHVNLN